MFLHAKPFNAVHVSDPGEQWDAKEFRQGESEDGVKVVTFQSRRFRSSTLDVVTAVGRIDVSAFCAAGNAASRTWTPHLSNPETSEIESFPLKRGQALEFP